jgi:hypothetical protein
MQANDYRTDPAITFVNARIEHACVTLAVLAQHVFVEDLNDLAQANIGRRALEKVSTLCPASRLYKSRLVQKPHKLSGVGRRDALALRDLRKCETFSVG